MNDYYEHKLKELTDEIEREALIKLDAFGLDPHPVEDENE